MPGQGRLEASTVTTSCPLSARKVDPFCVQNILFRNSAICGTGDVAEGSHHSGSSLGGSSLYDIHSTHLLVCEVQTQKGGEHREEGSDES